MFMCEIYSGIYMVPEREGARGGEKADKTTSIIILPIARRK